MRTQRFVNGVLVALSAVGVTATLFGVTLGVGPARDHAQAAPQGVPAGTLGIGERQAPPLDVVDSDSKVSIATEATAPALLTATAKAWAPVPKPAPARRPAARVASTTSRASAGGWSSARVSWYGPGFYGRHTASGPILTQGMMNVAHRSLPFGTRIQFEYRGKTCTAVVNDRGPYVGGRTFDLGPGTAAALGFSGVGTVRYRILGR